jgi:hypothetical protein
MRVVRRDKFIGRSRWPKGECAAASELELANGGLGYYATDAVEVFQHATEIWVEVRSLRQLVEHLFRDAVHGHIL